MATTAVLATGAAAKLLEGVDSPVDVDVPADGLDFWEQSKVAKQIAKFTAAEDVPEVVPAQSMPMLVAVRVRPLWDKELEGGDYSTVRVIEGKVVVVLDPWYDADLNPNRAKEKKYAFDVVFDEKVGQDEVYQKTARGLVGGVLDGYNSSVFAYGATGAGKTHTMLGSLEHPGVMVNTLHDLFELMKEAKMENAKFKVTLSYMEIYNELIKDLLQPTSVDLKLNEDPVRGMVVQGITEYGADSADEILELLHRGNMHRAVEPTAANQVSSRSHAVLQITVEQSEATAHVTGNVRIGKLSMVDLAGSERASKTDNTGQRLKEGANINRSLLALGNCITALADKNRKGHVPFRDSKMTRLLKDSLGGNCRTVMIANISPSHRQFEETINTLKYANRAKNLKTQVARNVLSVSAHIAEYQRVIMELRNEVADLKSALKSVHDGPPAPELTRKQRSLDHVDNLEKQHMQQLKDAIMNALSERRRLLLKLTEASKAVFEARRRDSEAAKSADGAGAGAGAGTGSSSLDADGAPASSDAAAAPPDAGPKAQLHAALADCRRQLQANQQTINEIVSTAVQRISSAERLQLLQLLVRGKFLEVMNEELTTELGLRRSLVQAAMAQGVLPPSLMDEALSTESWYTEHRAALDFHGQMAKIEMGGSLRAPSIAQLLDQNLVSPQEATSSQNLGELVRPFTNHKSRQGATQRSGEGPLTRVGQGKAPAVPPLGKGSGSGGGGGLRDASRSSDAAASPLADGKPSAAALLTDLDLAEVGTEEDRQSSTSASDRNSRYGNSANSSLHSSRGPTSQRARHAAPPPLAALKARGLNANRHGSAERRHGSADKGGAGRRSASSASPTGSHPPTPSSSRPPSHTKVGGGTSRAQPPQPPQPRVKRFKPPVRGTTPVVHVTAGSAVGRHAASEGLTLPPIGNLSARSAREGQGVGERGAIGQQPLSAARLASARAAAAARQNPHRAQALSDAYGGSARPGAGVQRRLVPPPPPPSGAGSAAAALRQGSRRPAPAAPSQKLAQKLAHR